MPVWAWTNLLAHGDEGDLRTELSGLLHGEGMPAMSHGEEWHAARTYLAAEVLDAAEQAGGLGSIQSSALVPLEMKLADRATAAGWSCRQWVEAVRAALAGRRPTQRS